jgi:hypothetical protein
MNPTFKNWTLAVVAVASLLGVNALLESGDGMTQAEIEAAQAADLADARRHEAHLSRLVRECHRRRGPSAELLQIEGSDDYVCREGEIRPTPPEVLRRYAQLSTGAGS